MAKISRALISVSDKKNIIELSRGLVDLGISILSTGGTAKLLSENNIEVIEVSEYTGFPEMMDGRVKTLHPKVHGALLGRRGKDEMIMQEHGIEPIDLVVVNLYPFEQTVNQPDCSLDDAIENIDIGGPAMLRSAAKNHASVGVVVDVNDYTMILDELRENNCELKESTRFNLARKVFAHTANYDANVSNYLNSLNADGSAMQFPSVYTTQFLKKQELRYGENPHQSAAFYTQYSPPTGTLASARQLQGKELSYNNIADTDAAFECVLNYRDPACVIVKHANPCGVATADNIEQAYLKAYSTDPTSAFGGIIAFNRCIDEPTAQAIIEKQFVEVVIAPCIEASALEMFSSKSAIRILEAGHRQDIIQQINFKRVSGGLLVQDNDLGTIQTDQLKIVSKRAPSDGELRDLEFAWKVVKYVKSNAIIYARDRQTIGIGAGQMSRVYSAKIAAIKAGDEGLDIKGAVMASDAFFPFRDGIDSAAEAGIAAVIQPGGSVRDEEVIAAADEHGMAMVFTSMRHFLH